MEQSTNGTIYQSSSLPINASTAQHSTVLLHCYIFTLLLIYMSTWTFQKLISWNGDRFVDFCFISLIEITAQRNNFIVIHPVDVL